jgi:hypothetical protein
VFSILRGFARPVPRAPRARKRCRSPSGRPIRGSPPPPLLIQWCTSLRSRYSPNEMPNGRCSICSDAISHGELARRVRRRRRPVAGSRRPPPARELLEWAQHAVTDALGVRPGEHVVVTNQVTEPHTALRCSRSWWFSAAVGIADKATALEWYSMWVITTSASAAAAIGSSASDACDCRRPPPS